MQYFSVNCHVFPIRMLFLIFAISIFQQTSAIDFNFDWCDNETSTYFQPDMAELIDRFEYFGSECLFASTKIADRYLLVRTATAAPTPRTEIYFSIEKAKEFCRNYSAHLPFVNNQSKNDMLSRLGKSVGFNLPLGIKITDKANKTYAWDDGTIGTYFPPTHWSMADSNIRLYTAVINKDIWIDYNTPPVMSLINNQNLSGQWVFYCEQDRKPTPAFTRTTASPPVTTTEPHITTTQNTTTITTDSTETDKDTISIEKHPTSDTDIIVEKNRKIPLWVIILAILCALLLILVIVMAILAWRQRKSIRILAERASTIKARQAAIVAGQQKKIATKKTTHHHQRAKLKTVDVPATKQTTPKLLPPLKVVHPPLKVVDQVGGAAGKIGQQQIGPKNKFGYASLGHSSPPSPAYLNVKQIAGPTANKQTKIVAVTPKLPVPITGLGQNKQVAPVANQPVVSPPYVVIRMPSQVRLLNNNGGESSESTPTTPKT